MTNADQLAHEVLDQLALMVLVVDAQLRLHASNAAARAMLRTADGIEERRGHLWVGAPNAHTDLQRAVRRATLPMKRVGSALRVPRGGGSRLLRIAPLEGDHARGSRLAVVVVADVHPRACLVDLLRDSFGLTGREVQIAILIGTGMVPKEVAAVLDTAWNTVRCQLRMVFAKTETAGQAQLVRMIHQLATLLDQPPLLHGDSMVAPRAHVGLP